MSRVDPDATSLAHRTWPPVLGICGHSGSGKTTLLEFLVRQLSTSGFDVACVKHSHHAMALDAAGKDTDRLFQAGATVMGVDPTQTFLRSRPGRAGGEYAGMDRSLDVVFVEGNKESPLPKLWMLGEGETRPPDGVSHVLATLARGEQRFERASAIVSNWLAQQHREWPVSAGILVGGKSRRMGRDKALLPHKGGVLLEYLVRVAGEVASSVVLLGRGAAPPALGDLPRVPDAPGVAGPLAGILAAFRWAPDQRWLIIPCDMPRMCADALRLLLDEARPGRWAVLPHLEGREFPEPLGALYEPAMGPRFEAAKLAPNQSPWRAFRKEKLHVVEVQGALAEAWTGVNTPEEWQQQTRAQR